MSSSEKVTVARYVRLNDVVAYWAPVSPSTVWRWVRRGVFPKPVRLPGRITAWRLQDLQDWLNSVDQR